MSCPRCGRAAPLIQRDGAYRCSACGAVRSYWSAPSLAHAGRPTRWLGVALRVLGVFWLLASWLGGALALWLQSAIFPSVAWLFWIDLALVLAATVLALATRWMGGLLVARGRRVEEAVRTAAIVALADRHPAGLTAREVSGALLLPEADADQALTELVLAERARADVDDHRGLVYRVGTAALPSPGAVLDVDADDADAVARRGERR